MCQLNETSNVTYINHKLIICFEQQKLTVTAEIYKQEDLENSICRTLRRRINRDNLKMKISTENSAVLQFEIQIAKEMQIRGYTHKNTFRATNDYSSYKHTFLPLCFTEYTHVH